MSDASLPWRYRLYRPLHNQLTHLGKFAIFGRSPSVVVRNRLNRFLYKTLLTHQKHATVATKAGFLLCVPLFDQAAASILFEHEYAPEEARTHLTLLEESEGLLDIGANLGYFACLALHAFRQKPDFQVIAVEPNPELCLLLEESAKANHFPEGRLHLLHAAIGEKNGEALFVWERSLSSNAHFASSPPIPSSHRQAMTDILSLDTILAEHKPRRWLIKIEVEGAELAVLQGGQTAFESRSLFLCKISSSPALLDGILKKHRYQVLRYSGEPISLFVSRLPKDLLFVPEEVASSLQAKLRRSPR